MEQFDQLLTCCVCLDRYRNPKLLPCQHSYCMEPCMEGLVDYVKRQVKCPECRAEHRIPYNGIQGFPSNITLQKFLELHTEITGELPDPNADAIMSRCNVCQEKAYIHPCAHCDKKVCQECKDAHCDILKREISRVNNQIKRGWHRLEDCLQQVERNQQQLELNGNTVLTEIEEIHRRLTLALKERTDHLRTNVEKYLVNEMRVLKELKNHLDLELTNIQSNSDLMEKHLSDDTKWDDNELMDCKEIFIKMMDFIRNYDPGSEEYTRRIRLTVHDQVNDIGKRILELGDLKLQDSKPKEEEDFPIRSSGLARSKSDHRLVADFRRREEEDLPRRRFGESRYAREDNKSRTNFGGRYDDDDEDESMRSRGRFRSRFLRNDDEDESYGTSNRKPMDQDEEPRAKRERTKVVETEDASRGPLSGCIRLADSSRIIQRLKEMEMEKLRPKKNPEPAVKPKPKPLPMPVAAPRQQTDDEIDKIKKANKAAESASTAATTRPATERSTQPAPTTMTTPLRTVAPASQASRVGVAGYGTPMAVQPAVASSSEEEEEDDEEDEYEYYDYDEESEESSSTPPPTAPLTPPVVNHPPSIPAAAAAPISVPTSELIKIDPDPPRVPSYLQRFAQSSGSGTTTTPSTQQATPPVPPHSRGPHSFVNDHASSSSSSANNARRPPVPTLDDDDSDEAFVRPYTPRKQREEGSSFVDKYLAQTRQSASNTNSNNNSARTTPKPQNTPKPASNTVNNEPETRSATQRISGESQYPSGRSRYTALKERQARLARSKSSAVVGDGNNMEDDEKDDDKESEEDDSAYTPFTSRFGGELARSRSSHMLKRERSTDSGSSQQQPDDENLSSWAKYLKAKYGNRKSQGKQNSSRDSPSTESNPKASPILKRQNSGPAEHYMQKQQLLMAFGKRGSQSGCFTWPRGIAVGPNNCIVVADSSNHRVQIFNEKGKFSFSFGAYGNSEGEFDCLAGVAVNRIGQYIIADRYNHRVQIFDPSGNFLRAFGSQGTTDGKFSYPWGITTDALGFIYVCDKENHRVQVFQSDGSFVGKFGSHGKKPGQLEHPHYVAVSNTNRVIVSDSNNHRIQIFDVNGKVLTTFGSEGTDFGQFKFPRGVAVDEQGYIFVADSGNNRIQIFNPDGGFIRCFGRWGTGEAEFKGLEGISVNSNGNILIADRENHRVQMF